MVHALMLLCAGSGSRMKQVENKVLSLLDGKPVFMHSLERMVNVMEPRCIVIVCRPDEESIIRRHINEVHDNLSGRIVFVPGGDTRQESVMNGLRVLPKECETIHIHDGARPLVDDGTLLRVMSAVETFDAVCVGMPVKDTMKIVGEDGIVIETPDRSRYWSIQTPQSFKIPLVRLAYDKAEENGTVATDDASLVEKLGIAVHMVEGDYKNIKITTPEDMDLAELILRRMRS